MRILLFLASILLLSGCPDLSTPPELLQPQIIVVEADPPSVGLGERAALDVVVAGPDGRIDPDAVTWQVTDDAPGAVEDDGLGNWEFVAPSEEGTSSVILRVEVDVGADQPLLGVKTVSIGETRANPEITDVHVDGTAVAGDTPVSLPTDTEVDLDVSVAPASTEDSIVSWFSTAGELDLYRRTPTTILTAEEPTSGVLFVVYRDGVGGVAWREVAISVE